MIQPQDLRIGNYVFRDGKIFQITKGFEIDNSNCKAITMTPIPLTEEWLVKFGLKQVKDMIWQLTTEDFCITVSFNDCGYIAITDKQIHFEYKGYPMVHEFQNMFALTLKELKFKN